MSSHKLNETVYVKVEGEGGGRITQGKIVGFVVKINSLPDPENGVSIFNKKYIVTPSSTYIKLMNDGGEGGSLKTKD